MVAKIRLFRHYLAINIYDAYKPPRAVFLYQKNITALVAVFLCMKMGDCNVLAHITTNIPMPKGSWLVYSPPCRRQPGDHTKKNHV